MPHPERADLDALVQALIGAGVEFIVVGGAAAVLHGAPITTQDLDIVHRRTPEKADRFADLLDRRQGGRWTRTRQARITNLAGAARSAEIPIGLDPAIPDSGASEVIEWEVSWDVRRTRQ